MVVDMAFARPCRPCRHRRPRRRTIHTSAAVWARTGRIDVVRMIRTQHRAHGDSGRV